jgi:hypothetical protein
METQAGLELEDVRKATSAKKILTLQPMANERYQL